MELATARLQFRILRRPAGWTWIMLRADAGVVLATASRVHPTAEACRHTIGSIQRAGADRYRVACGQDGHWRWEVVDPAGVAIGRSALGHADPADCRGEAARFRSLAPRAALVHAPVSVNPASSEGAECRPAATHGQVHSGRERQHAGDPDPSGPRPPSLKRHRRHAAAPLVTLAEWNPGACHVCVSEQRTYGRWVGEQRRLGRSLLVPVDRSRAALAHLSARGLSVPTIARLTGLNPETLRRILAGKTNVTRARTEEKLLALAEV